MKNKNVTYLLGALVLIVWGVIVYRIFNAISDDDSDAIAPVQNIINREDLNDYAVAPDTTKLLLNYKDPFRLVKMPDTANRNIQQTAIVKTTPTVQKQVFNWGFVKYSGFTRSAGSKTLLAIMVINGQSAILKEGETSADVKLIKNYQDSVKVEFKGKIGYIKMQY